MLDSSQRGVWSLTERGRTTTLTYRQAHEIFRCWVAIFPVSRERWSGGQAKASSSPQARL
ncbi:hypothetical protein [Castellaniella sp.]|uniref:hypothetical protein n=1 Tax=Castellaniella sp. TaxID=1955812 RepID=UPI00345CDCAF